jgi:hypothetical protein
MGVGEALETTFSGESPCALCMAVQAGQEKENSSMPQQTKDGGKLKLEVTLSGGIVALVPPPPLAQVHAQEMTPAIVASQPEPPVPPPRALA